MSEEELDKLWREVERIGVVNYLHYNTMIVLGSVFGEMRSEIVNLQEKNDKLSAESILIM